MSVSSATFIFCPPSLGKPDSRQEKPLHGPDTRSRVIQLGSKDDTCWYAVSNLLRERYKAPNTTSLKKENLRNGSPSCASTYLLTHALYQMSVISSIMKASVISLHRLPKQKYPTRRLLP